MVSFRVIDGITRPMGSGVSSSITGAPSISGAVLPKGYRPPRREGQSGGIFSPQYSTFRLLEKAASARQQARDKVEEARSAQKAQDLKYTLEQSGNLKKERLDENRKIEEEIERRKRGLASMKAVGAMERNERELKMIQETEKQIEDVNWKMKNFSPGSSIEALKYQAALKGDRDAMEILKAIGNNDWGKAKKLVERRDQKLNEAFAQKSRLESEEGKKILNSLGFTTNAQGQYIPTSRTSKIANEEYDEAISEAELAEMKKNPIAVAPNLTAREINILSESEEGRRRLREWGFAIGVEKLQPSVKNKTFGGGVYHGIYSDRIIVG